MKLGNFGDYKSSQSDDIKKANLTQEDIANIMHTKISNISKLESFILSTLQNLRGFLTNSL